jgi:membrane fusion protein, multidrug efflux system
LAENAKSNQRKRKTLALILFPLLVAIGAAAFYFYLQYKRTHISTDDAYVDGRVHLIASKVPGTVKALPIKDNQLVEKGTLLLEIDPIDYEVKLQAAAASLKAERARFSELEAQVESVEKQLLEAIAGLKTARANLELEEANLRQAEKDFQREEFLEKKELIARQEYERSQTAYEVAQAQVKAARDRVQQLEASLETQRALIKQTKATLPPQKALIQQKEAELKEAELNRNYTRIYAPSRGYITKRTVEVGNQIQADQPLMAVVPLDPEDIWITANYKETDLKRVKPGQRVEIKVDTFPGKEFYGRVNSIMAGTGAVFSLFPPENATGNFVKVVQRVPVKIVLEKGEDAEHLLRIGMSVIPTILIEP